MHIAEIHWSQTIPIRHSVLWPHQPASFCQLEGDDAAWHYGAWVDGQLVGVASIFVEGGQARLRKFATLPAYQQQGIGSALLKHAMAQARAQGLSHFWCDARESALGFYARFGLEPQGERFFKADVAYFKMACVLGLSHQHPVSS